MPNAYYLKLGSGKSQVFGTSRDRYHVGWIKLTGFYPLSDSRATSMVGDGGGGPGKVTSSEIAVTKWTDRSSPELMQAAHGGRPFNSADLEIANEQTGIPKLRMSFTHVLLGRHGSNGGGLSDPGPVETFTLQYADMKLNHNPIPEESVVDMLQTVFKSLGLAPAQ